MNPMGLAYIALVLSAHTVVLFLPVRFPDIDRTEHAALFLLLALATSLPAMRWPGLRLRDLIALLILLPFVELSFMRFFASTGWPVFEDYFLEHDWTDILRGWLFQALSVFVISVSFWIRSRYEHFSLRRAGSDREEQERMLNLKRSMDPEENLTYLKYSRLLTSGISLIGERRLRMRAMVHLVRRDDTIFFYDFLIVPGEETYRDQFFEMLLQRLELTDPTIMRQVFLLPDRADTLRFMLSEEGFQRIDDDNAQLIGDLRRSMSRVLKDQFSGWRPFQKVRHFYIRQSPAFTEDARVREPERR